MHFSIAKYKHTSKFFNADDTTPIIDIITKKPKFDVHIHIITAAGILAIAEASVHCLK